uniref:Macaca fascicularis brain cDNA clone: QbsB-10595, similar to human hypothetical protein MGC33424 (MGC33424), mRNA, RefSeq: NM_153705.2 n=1 Tax=Macaca fascicularis TaxID=9541 RepID=I7GM62_MACFA|nr:unnamed protein product [Macaca fascicularis]
MKMFPEPSPSSVCLRYAPIFGKSTLNFTYCILTTQNASVSSKCVGVSPCPQASSQICSGYQQMCL